MIVSMNSEDKIDRLTRLFQGHYGLVVGVVRRFAPFADYVDDIIQQVYLEFIEGGLDDKWELDRDVAPLLHLIAKRKAFSMWQEHRKSQNRLFDETVERLREPMETESREREQEKLAALTRCLERLPSKSRAIVEQHYFAGVSMKAIAEEQSKKTTTIHQFFFRIRSVLRACIEHTIDADLH